MIFKGLNFGVDFKGGTLIELRVNDSNVLISDVRKSFSNMNLGDVSVKKFGNDKDYVIKIEKKIKTDPNFIDNIEKKTFIINW